MLPPKDIIIKTYNIDEYISLSKKGYIPLLPLPSILDEKLNVIYEVKRLIKKEYVSSGIILIFNFNRALYIRDDIPK